jgi:hypothetical protein
MTFCATRGLELGFGKLSHVGWRFAVRGTALASYGTAVRGPSAGSIQSGGNTLLLAGDARHAS